MRKKHIDSILRILATHILTCSAKRHDEKRERYARRGAHPKQISPLPSASSHIELPAPSIIKHKTFNDTKQQKRTGVPQTSKSALHIESRNKICEISTRPRHPMKEEMLRVEITKLDGKKVKLITPFEGFGMGDLGIKYLDPDLGFPTTITYNKIKSFKIEGDVGELEAKRSEALQKRYSDENPLAKKRSADWTV